MINDTLDVFQQRHQVPAVARPCILNKGTLAPVQTVGRYLPKQDRFNWQQKIVQNAKQAYWNYIGIHKYSTQIN